MSDIVKCKINGLDLEFAKGITIIEAFKKIEKDIAHYCWHPGLSVAGVCRLCMVEIEGMDKLQIACNTKIQEGMVITNQSKKVEEALRWGLEFHLINHPLDCPICDQAGECELQDQYMKYGSYRPAMAESKVKKRKVVDLGSKIVLDTERCILCTRCVRFTDEVTQTHELGVFKRGDKSEIGVFKDKPLENNYAVNTVDICPVGALTSKDFRFQQRVWYLKTKKSVCVGCSTGCSIDMDYNEQGPWRIRPHYNPEVNGYWMCDEGRGIYKHIRYENRLKVAQKGDGKKWQPVALPEALKELKEELDKASRSLIVLTGQYTNEEYDALKNFFKDSSFYHWINNEKKLKDFDGFLLRGDKNPNTAGLKKTFSQLKTFKDFELDVKDTDCVIVFGPENQSVFPELKERTLSFVKGKKVFWFATNFNSFFSPQSQVLQIPMKSFFEKTGTFTNFQGKEQKINEIQPTAFQALSLEDLVQLLGGEKWDQENYFSYFKHNQFIAKKENMW